MKRFFIFLSMLFFCTSLAIGQTESVPEIEIISEESSEPVFICPLPQGPQPTLSSFENFKTLPVMESGRLKPLDTYARNVLLQLSGQRSFNKKDAIDWLSGVIFGHSRIKDEKVFLINHPDIAYALEIEPEKKRLYSYGQLEANLQKLVALASKARQIEDKERSIVENEIVRLESNVRLFIQLSNSFAFAIPHADFTITDSHLKTELGLPVERSSFSFLEIAMNAGSLQEIIGNMQGRDSDKWNESEKEIFKTINNLYTWTSWHMDSPLHILPSQVNEGTWVSGWQALLRGLADTTLRSQVIHLYDLFHYGSTAQQINFDLSLKQLKLSINENFKDAANKKNRLMHLEVIYNKLNLILWSKILYLISFLLFFLSFLIKQIDLHRSVLILTAATFLIHSAAIIIRMLILERPPVSTLYETFIFVAWTSVLAGLIIELINKRWLGLLISSISGFIFLAIAGKYAMEGDTLKMLVAVLNSNFWLSTHVITITIGYAGVCVAGIVGHVYLLQAAFSSNNKELLKSTYGILLGTLGFGLVMAFLGTNLGGIWADQSWGRFWGWDPKENGALLIILWTALLFHAKIANLIKATGLAVGSILGIIVVMWAWFGVNLLNVGLHSYGFTSGIAINLIIYVVLQILFILIVYPIAKRKSNIK
ncbi:MAG: ABC-type transport system involved in cytochrome c biogenesis permease subunit [Candidatus Omnitrophota bacterium]|jgi:ABC-type transport system involved in cytochrome c biogenesis permease subunit